MNDRLGYYRRVAGISIVLLIASNNSFLNLLLLESALN